MTETPSSTGSQTLDDYADSYGYDLASNRVRLEKDASNADPMNFQ